MPTDKFSAKSKATSGNERNRMMQIPHPSYLGQEAPKTKPRQKPLKKFEGLMEQEERFVFPEP